MAFWSTQRIEREQPQKELFQPFDRKRIQQGAYELSLGEEALISGEKKPWIEQGSGARHLNIPPGQFGLLWTDEVVRVPEDAIGLISIKAGVKLKGLVNVSGFHVDPGFCGKLKFSVYNAGTRGIPLLRGDPVFMIWFADFDTAVRDPYKGRHQGQNSMSPEDHERMADAAVSPAALKERVEELEKSLRLYRDLGAFALTVVLLPLAFIIYGECISKWLNDDNGASQPKAAIQQPDPAQTPAVDAVPVQR